ncbi:MAG TPA: hypothetical protein VK797_22255 [Tepidisphaeraceae bacterium]|nr:hypothetical protein [Tepidisphaeraceae bacterium]
MKTERVNMKTEDRRRETEGRSRPGVRVAFILSSVFCLLSSLSSPTSAAPTQNDVFKSIQDNVSHPTDLNSTPVILLVLGGALVMALLVYFSRREQKVASAPTTLNHPGKLAREVLKTVPLKPAEMKQLKLLADSIESDAGEPIDPLTLLLCPSLLAKGVKANPARLDRKAVAQVVRRLRIGQ